jgi:RNA polymerase sigma factor (sigma-70 family)
MSSDDEAKTILAAGHFATTHWTVVLLAGQASSPLAAEALEKLCRTYWYPLYAFVRRQGHDADAAQDLTQEFFSRLLAKNYLADVHPAKGRFRSFLLAALKHFLADEWDRARALKRGGGKPPISLDDSQAESRYIQEPAHDLAPDKIYERRWALTVLENALANLESEFARAGKQPSFDLLKNYLSADAGFMSYAEAGLKLGISEGAIKVAVHRMRQRYAELLRQEIAHTVQSPADVEDEIRHLFRALA